MHNAARPGALEILMLELRKTLRWQRNMRSPIEIMEHFRILRHSLPKLFINVRGPDWFPFPRRCQSVISSRANGPTPRSARCNCPSSFTIKMMDPEKFCIAVTRVLITNRQRTDQRSRVDYAASEVCRGGVVKVNTPSLWVETLRPITTKRLPRASG